jgi:hypothetical protein
MEPRNFQEWNDSASRFLDGVRNITYEQQQQPVDGNGGPVKVGY